MLPRSLLQTAILVLISLLILLYLFRSSPTIASLKPGAALPAAQRQPRVLTNPYTSWWLAFHQEKRTHTLVIAKLKAENVSWIDTELTDLPDLQKAVYVVDDQDAPLHTPANKGNEAMVYLSYIIDFYKKLPDVSIFVHSHASAWHVGDLFNGSTAEMLRRLSLEKVAREGYVNLRCEIWPGCPVAASLDRTEDPDPDSKMNGKVLEFFQQMFPNDPLPTTLAQPCCAQFALSRDIILKHPKSYYEALRNWILETDLPKVITGRVFEYAWHYLFTNQPVFCPSEQICFCDAYAICFPTKNVWLEYQDIQKTKKALLEEHRHLAEDDERTRKHISLLIDGLHDAAQRRVDEAFFTGSNGVVRQQVLYDGWEDLKLHGQL